MSKRETNCELCGEPMPPGEEMFFYHGYSGPCPKPPLPKAVPSTATLAQAAATECGKAWCCMTIDPSRLCEEQAASVALPVIEKHFDGWQPPNGNRDRLVRCGEVACEVFGLDDNNNSPDDVRTAITAIQSRLATAIKDIEAELDDAKIHACKCRDQRQRHEWHQRVTAYEIALLHLTTAEGSAGVEPDRVSADPAHFSQEK